MTAAVHLLLAIAILAEMHAVRSGPSPARTIAVVTLPLTPDEEARKPRRGAATVPAKRRPVAIEAPPPVLDLPLRSTAMTSPADEPDEPADGGQADQPAETTERYRHAITDRIAAARRYPRAALLDGYQGTGAILFRIDRDGRLLDLSIEASTGRRELDHAALALIRRAAPFPVIPAELPDELAITMPIRFVIVGAPMAVAAR